MKREAREQDCLALIISNDLESMFSYHVQRILIIVPSKEGIMPYGLHY